MVSGGRLLTHPSDGSSNGGSEGDSQRAALEAKGEQLASKKTLVRMRKMIWWLTVRIGIGKNVQWCLGRERKKTEGKKSGATIQAIFYP